MGFAPMTRETSYTYLLAAAELRIHILCHGNHHAGDIFVFVFVTCEIAFHVTKHALDP